MKDQKNNRILNIKARYLLALLQPSEGTLDGMIQIMGRYRASEKRIKTAENLLDITVLSLFTSSGLTPENASQAHIKIVPAFKKYASSTKLSQHISACKELLEFSNDPGYLIDALSHINLFVLDLMGIAGVIECVTADDRYRVRNDALFFRKLTLFDSLLWSASRGFTCSIHTAEGIPVMTPSAVKDARQYYRDLLGPMGFEDIIEFCESSHVRALHSMQYTVPSQQLLAFYRSTFEQDEVPFAHGLLLGTVSKESMQSCLGFYLCIIAAVGEDILMHRKVYLKDDGVVIAFAGGEKDELLTFNGVSRLFMYEVHQGREHYIVVDYTLVEAGCESATKTMILPIKQINMIKMLVVRDSDMMAIMIAFKALGLLDRIKQRFTEILNGDYAEDADIFSDIVLEDEETNEKVAATILKSVEVAESIAIVFEDPISWNNREGEGPCDSLSRESRARPKGSGVYKECSVCKYVRRLPPGQVASDEAKALANRCLIILDDEHTLVNDFTRKVRMTLK